MAIQWDTIQVRTVDPFSPVYSDNVSALSAAISKGTGRGVCSGLVISLPNATHLQITKGVALKDYITIHFTADVILNIAETSRGPGANYVVLVYRYAKLVPAPIATIDVIPVGSYNPLLHLILGTVQVTPNSQAFTNITDDARELNPLFTFLALLDTPDSYAGQKGKVVIVDPTETKLIFGDLMQMLLALGFRPAAGQSIVDNSLTPIIDNSGNFIASN